jgi:large subunit ribosomal protein L25
MTDQIVLKAQPRTDMGTRAARRIRRSGLIPANIYGHKEEQLLVTVDAKELTKFLDAGHRFATLRVGDKDQRSVVKEVQYDALGARLIHVDFTRISRDEKLRVEVPVEAVGVPKGTAAGGVLVFPLKELLVEGLPDDIPEHYAVNIEALEVGQSIRVKDLQPPANCIFVVDPESVVLMVAQQREEVPTAPAEVQPAQPEVIGKKKEELPEEGEAPEAKKKEKEK